MGENEKETLGNLLFNSKRQELELPKEILQGMWEVKSQKIAGKTTSSGEARNLRA